MTQSTVYYCEMCKISHSRIEPRATCGKCGRVYCHSSLEEIIAVNVNSCPYCDELLKNFSGISWEIKRSLVPTTEYVAPENTMKDSTHKVKILEKAGIITTTKPTRKEEAWSNEDTSTQARRNMLKKRAARKKAEMNVASNPFPPLEKEQKEIIEKESGLYEQTHKRKVKSFHPFKTKRSKSRRRRRRRPLDVQIMGYMPYLMAIGVVLLIFTMNPNIVSDLQDNLNTWDITENPPPIDCKFTFDIRGNGGNVTDGWISIYEDEISTQTLETAEVKYGMFTSARYYDPDELFHIRYSRSETWEAQNRTLLLISDYVGGSANFPTEYPSTVEIKPMLLNATS